MSVPHEIVELVERFEENLAAYTSGNYNEAQLRREFIDPFFKALGWDIDNTAGNAEAYKDVIHEDAIRIGGAVSRRKRSASWRKIDKREAIKCFRQRNK